MTQQSHSWAYREKHGSKGFMHPTFFAMLFIITKTWKQPKYPLTDK